MRTSSIAAVFLTLVAGASFATAPAPERYDVQLRITRAGALLAAPHLTSRAGETATFMSDDGKHNSWTITLKATPDLRRQHRVAVDWSMSFTQPLISGGISTRRTSTTLLLAEPGHAALDLPTAAEIAPVHVELGIARAAGDQ